ncbi:hypothetical protein F511_47448 [Dorcoceras hygrometricum]|uniref:Uncharacterized protein n=1 Tax=Dorcoceras hygrometricum TaxID=472368 RepID=A0A2Z6ZQZ7_9LAMI|nr:hypothetical protein F511_47448 [Dorcoceras hygrometricum]
MHAASVRRPAGAAPAGRPPCAIVAHGAARRLPPTCTHCAQVAAPVCTQPPCGDYEAALRRLF